MKKNYFLIALVILSGVTFSLQAQNSNLNFNFSERIRTEGWDNALDLDNSSKKNQQYLRIKTSAGVNWQVGSELEFDLKLTNEMRKFLTPSDNPYHFNELFFESLYIKYKPNLSFKPEITLGRQNLIFGEGFVMQDGTPGDGSRSMYFNALRIDVSPITNNKISAFLAYQPYEDDVLPILNGRDVDNMKSGQKSYLLVEQSEVTAGAYYEGIFGQTNLQGYYIWKKIEDEGLNNLGLQKSNIHTIGARVKYPVMNNLSIVGEGAYQFGDKGNIDRSAYGGYGYLEYLIPSKEIYIPNNVTLGGNILSGDDNKSSNKYEGWEPLFGRWPKWSEALVYTSITENGKVAYWTNIISAYLKTKFDLGQSVVLDLGYTHLFAEKDGSKTGFISNRDNDRGGLISTKISYQVNKNFSGHFLWEHFNPGHFYFSGADNFDWMRFEIMFKI